jgi:hypothetical protein
MTGTLELRKHGAVFVLDGSPSAAALRPRRGMRSAEITVDGRTVDGRTVEVAVTDHRPCGVATTDGLLRLDPRGGRTPTGGPVLWSIERDRGVHVGSVVRGADRIELRLPRMCGRQVEISATGLWPDLELIALAGSFALIAWRRNARVRAMAVAGAIGHG